MTASHAAPASTNAPLVQSLKAKSTPSTPTYALTAALALTYAPLVLSLRANNCRLCQLNSFPDCSPKALPTGHAIWKQSFFYTRLPQPVNNPSKSFPRFRQKNHFCTSPVPHNQTTNSKVAPTRKKKFK